MCAEENIERFRGQLDATERLNVDGFYPTLFQKVSGIFVSADIQQSVTITRLLNVLIVVLLMWLGICFSRTDLGRVIPLTITVGSIPLGLFVLSSNNPSSWSLMSLFVYAFLVASIEYPLRFDNIKRLLLPIVTVTVAALGSRPDAPYFLSVITVGSLLIALESVRLRTRITVVTSIFVVLIFVSLYFSSAKTAEFVSQGFMEGAYAISGKDILNFNIQALPQLVFGNFGFSLAEIQTRTGHLGWFNAPVPPISSFLAFGTYVVLLTLSSRDWQIGQKLTLAYFSLALCLIPLAIHQKDNSVIGQYVQPRYLMVLLLLILGFALFRSINASQTRGFTIGIVATLSTAHLAALYLLIRRYSAGYGDFGWSLNRGAQWWGFDPVSPNVLLVTATLSFAAFAYTSLRIISIRFSVR